MNATLWLRVALACCLSIGVAAAAQEGDVDIPKNAQLWVDEHGVLQTADDFFPILPWDPLHGWQSPYENRKHGLESIAACNYTMAGFLQAQDLDKAEELGLVAIMAPMDAERPARRDFNKMSDAEIADTVQALIEAGGASPIVAGYYIVDEPGATFFPGLGKAVSEARRLAPGKLAYINLFPGYATIGAPDKSQLETESFTEYLERFVEEVDPAFISYDNYQVQYSQDMAVKERAKIYYDDLLEVRRVAQESGLPFWNIVSSNQIRPFSTPPSPANLALQAYTTLAAGGKGLTWYTYYARGYEYAPIADDGEKTQTWYWLQEINRQVKLIGPKLNRATSTGVYFTEPRPVEGLPPVPSEYANTVESAEPLMIGVFDGEDGAPHVMFVNLSLERSTRVRLDTAVTGENVQYYSSADGRLRDWDHENGQWITAGQGLLVRFGQ